MKSATIYLMFNGQAHEAMTTYKQILDADLDIMKFSDMPQSDCPVGKSDLVMHARLVKGATVIMASDTTPDRAVQTGDNFSITLDCESKEEADRLFNAFGESGKNPMPLADMFWGAYWGMVTDRFGISWMFNYEYPKTAQ